MSMNQGGKRIVVSSEGEQTEAPIRIMLRSRQVVTGNSAA